MSTDDRESERKADEDSVPTAPCPVCGFPMVAIRGSKAAVCSNCGFKDSCCYLRLPAQGRHVLWQVGCAMHALAGFLSHAPLHA